jgi:hypothetical protein
MLSMTSDREGESSLVAEAFPTIYREPDGLPIGRLKPDGTLELILPDGRPILLGWVTPDGSVFKQEEQERGSGRFGWVVDGTGYRATRPDEPVVRVTAGGVILDSKGRVAGNVVPPDPLAGAALFVALSL